MEFAQDWNQVLQSLLNKFCLPHYSFWKPEHLPMLLLPTPFSFQVCSRAGPNTAHFFFFKSSGYPATYKPEVESLQSCEVLCINPFSRHGLCYLEATFIFTLFSLRIILLDTEDRGKIDTETLCFFYVTGFKLQTYLYPNLFFSEYI